jgi:hypothetical protein
MHELTLRPRRLIDHALMRRDPVKMSDTQLSAWHVCGTCRASEEVGQQDNTE